MRCQTLSDLEEIVWFENIAGFGATQPRYPQKKAGKSECMTADQWLDRYSDWCEPYKARISSAACKSRQKSELSEFCMGCKGIRNRSGNSNNGKCPPKRIVP